MNSFFEERKSGAEEAVAFKSGEHSHCRAIVKEIPVPEYGATDVARARAALNLSQRGLASALGVSTRTVEAWEAGKNIPSGAAQRLLYLLESDSSLVTRLIAR